MIGLIKEYKEPLLDKALCIIHLLSNTQGVIQRFIYLKLHMFTSVCKFVLKKKTRQCFR